MTLKERTAVVLLLILIQSGAYDCTAIKRNSNEAAVDGSTGRGSTLEKSSLDEAHERNLEQEILQELNHLSSRKQRQIFNDLEKQRENFNNSLKAFTLTEPENLSPLNVEEIKSIRNTIKATNTSLPPIRNKRTLNFLLHLVARAMGYTLTPTNPDAEWIPRSQPPPAQPCTTPQPPCTPNPPSTPPPCPAPPSTPPCPASGALMQPATVPPNKIDANTITYPYRPVRTIPLFNFAPLPAGVRVPYPPLLQAPTRQRPSCPPQQPSSPCASTPPPTPPPCMTAPPATPPPSRPTTPPCGPPSPPPPTCGTTPPPSPPPCKPTPTPPCGTTPAPKPPPCATTPAPPPPCPAAPSPSPPCATTPAPPPPCPAAPSPSPPCATTPVPPPPPCTNPPPPPPPPPSETPKKGSILLEYDDPVRIQIFSNGKKYLPASGSIYSGHDDVSYDGQKGDFHSSFGPGKEKDEDYEEKEKMEEEHFEEGEEEEEEETPGQLKNHEEEDERTWANDEENESETNLSVVKKPAMEDVQKINRRQLVASKTRTLVTDESHKKDEKENKPAGTSSKKKNPKRKKWVRIIKKQRIKSKTDSNPQNNFQVYSSDSFPESSQTAPKFYGKRDSHAGFDSFERDISDYSGDSSEDVTHIDLKKVIVNNKALHLPVSSAENRRYEFNPYALEPEEERRKKLEKAVERYVEDYVEKQLGDELVKNTGVPKTTVFEFAPKNGPKIQTITTTVAKTSRTGNPASSKLRNKPEIPFRFTDSVENGHDEENLRGRGRASFEPFAART